MANANVVPPDAEKLVFAVDVVRFFWNKDHPDLSFELIETDVANNVTSYRPQVRELFNDNIKKVLKDIDDTQLVLVRREYSEIKNKDGINGPSFLKYSTMFKNCNLNKDFQAGNFLTYCARIASMACLFYANGCNDALDIAVDLIKSSFPDDREKYNALLESMENAAMKYASDSKGEGASFLFRRETDTDVSGTEDSSSSSAFTSEAESASECQNMSSASSDESMTSLILRLNASVPGPICSTRRKSKDSTIASGPSSESTKSNTERKAGSSSSSSRTSEALKCDIDMPSGTERSMKGEGVEPMLQDTLLAESPRKSCLGKRRSPRKGNPPSSFGNVGDDSETEVKKPKISLPETDEENE